MDKYELKHIKETFVLYTNNKEWIPPRFMCLLTCKTFVKDKNTNVVKENVDMEKLEFPPVSPALNNVDPANLNVIITESYHELELLKQDPFPTTEKYCPKYDDYDERCNKTMYRRYFNLLVNNILSNNYIIVDDQVASGHKCFIFKNQSSITTNYFRRTIGINLIIVGSIFMCVFILLLLLLISIFKHFWDSVFSDGGNPR
jgi:hypothetical protein